MARRNTRRKSRTKSRRMARSASRRNARRVNSSGIHRHKVKAGRGKRGAIPVKKVVDPEVAKIMKVYEEAMRQFYKQSFRRAKNGFEKVLVGPSRELAERARVHISICEQRMLRPEPVRLRTADDHYNFAVSQINLGNYEAARAHLEKALRQAPKSEFVNYALASVSALTGEADDALRYLRRAIELRPENRYHARNDADFKLLEDDARFQELLYPERSPVAGQPSLHIY